MSIYDKMTQEEFHSILDDVVADHGWDVGDVRSILAEEYNNEVLDRWATNQGYEKCDKCDEFATPIEGKGWTCGCGPITGD